MNSSFLAPYEPRIVGSRLHEELWIPAEDIPEMNRNIVGLIVVTAKFHPNPA